MGVCIHLSRGTIPHVLYFFELVDISDSISGIFWRYIDSIPPIIAGVLDGGAYVYLKMRL